MKKDKTISYQVKDLFELVKKLKSVTRACTQIGISRTTYYNLVKLCEENIEVMDNILMLRAIKLTPQECARARQVIDNYGYKIAVEKLGIPLGSLYNMVYRDKLKYLGRRK